MNGPEVGAEQPAPGASERSVVSARVRIVGWYVLLLALALGAALLATRVVLYSDANSKISSDLSAEGKEAQALADTHVDARTGIRIDTMDQLMAAHLRGGPENDASLIGLVDGAVVAHTVPRSGGRPDLDAALVRQWSAVSALTYGRSADGRVRWVAVPATLGPGTPRAVLVYAKLPASDYAAIDRVIGVGALTSATALALVSLIAWVVGGRVLRPVRQVTMAANNIINGSDLRGRLPVRGNDELSALATTFNRMLDRLAQAFAEQRGFIADAGHELRTPITVVRGHLELLEHAREPARRTAITEVMTSELDRMNRLVKDLLVLDRAESGEFVNSDLVELEQLTRAIHAKAATLDDRQWTLDRAGIGSVVVDADRLTQAMLELAMNATRHDPAHAPVHLGSELVGGQIRLWVADHGPGVDDAEKQRIFHRFTRGSGRRPDSGGSGLGLAIVRAIATAHGGRVEVTDNAGGGAVFTLVIPAEPELPTDPSDEGDELP